MNAISDYTEFLNNKGLKYPPDIKPVDTKGDLDKILAALVSSQDKQVLAQNKCMDKLVKSHGNSGPKATQPIFTSKNNDSDYANYRDFFSRFEFFVLKCSSNVEKLQWLKSSVKGDAAFLIKNLSLNDDNYQTALDRLSKRYLNPETVKHSLLQSVIGFKCGSNPKYTKAQSAMTNFANNLEELKTVHKFPIGNDCICKELLRETAFIICLQQ